MTKKNGIDADDADFGLRPQHCVGDEETGGTSLARLTQPKTQTALIKLGGEGTRMLGLALAWA